MAFFCKPPTPQIEFHIDLPAFPINKCHCKCPIKYVTNSTLEVHKLFDSPCTFQ